MTNRFDDADINYWHDDAVTYLSRSDWQGTYPVEPVRIALTDEMIKVLNADFYRKPEGAPSVSDFIREIIRVYHW